MIDRIQQVSSLPMTDGPDMGLDMGVGEIGSSGNSGFGSSAVTPGQNTGMDFGSIMADMAKDTIDNLKGAEAMSFQAIQGKASTREVVDAVLQAQQSLHTAMALRDKIVTAWMEVSKMQI